MRDEKPNDCQEQTHHRRLEAGYMDVPAEALHLLLSRPYNGRSVGWTEGLLQTLYTVLGNKVIKINTGVVAIKSA